MKIAIENKKGIKLCAICCVLFIISMLLLAGCTSNEATNMNSVTGFYFDTVVSIQAEASNDVLSYVLSKCEYYEKLLSRTIEGSDVWNINNSFGKPVVVSKDTMEVLQFAQKMAEDTNGAFDITIAPVMELWDFNSVNPMVPEDNKIKEVLSKVGYNHIKLYPKDLTVELDLGSKIDLGGIAKGFIADKIGEILIEEGVKVGILNFGGNVLLIGEKADGSPWKVGVQNPKENTGDFLGVISCNGNNSVVTSGTYERYFTLEDVRYHHILDPKTGMPVQNGLAGVTILTESSMEADAFSTACFVLGPKEGFDFVNKHKGVEAIFVLDSGELKLTDSMKDYYSE